MSPLDRILQALEEQAQIQPPTSGMYGSIKMVKKTAKVIRNLCGADLENLLLFIKQKSILEAIGWVFQWNAGSQSRLHSPKVEQVLTEGLIDVFESLSSHDDEGLVEKLWGTFTHSGEYYFIT